MPSAHDEKTERLKRAAKLLELIAADTKRRAQADSESAKRMERVADDIRTTVERDGK